MGGVHNPKPHPCHNRETPQPSARLWGEVPTPLPLPCTVALAKPCQTHSFGSTTLLRPGQEGNTYRDPSSTSLAPKHLCLSSRIIQAAIFSPDALLQLHQEALQQLSSHLSPTKPRSYHPHPSFVPFPTHTTQGTKIRVLLQRFFTLFFVSLHNEVLSGVRISSTFQMTNFGFLPSM